MTHLLPFLPAIHLYFCLCPSCTPTQSYGIVPEYEAKPIKLAIPDQRLMLSHKVRSKPVRERDFVITSHKLAEQLARPKQDKDGSLRVAAWEYHSTLKGINYYMCPDCGKLYLRFSDFIFLDAFQVD